MDAVTVDLMYFSVRSEMGISGPTSTLLQPPSLTLHSPPPPLPTPLDENSLNAPSFEGSDKTWPLSYHEDIVTVTMSSTANSPPSLNNQNHRKTASGAPSDTGLIVGVAVSSSNESRLYGWPSGFRNLGR